MIAQPLTRLMRKDCKFVWYKDCEGALKKSLTSALVLTLPYEGIGYEVFNDASKNGVGQLCFDAVREDNKLCVEATEGA